MVSHDTVPEKVDLFLLNVEVCVIVVWVQKSWRGLLGAGQGRRVWQSLLRMSAQQLPHGIPSKPAWVL